MKHDIIDIIEQTPFRGASDGSIHGRLAVEGIETTRADVRRVCDALVDEGTLKQIGQKGASKRYRLSEGDTNGRA